MFLKNSRHSKCSMHFFYLCLSLLTFLDSSKLLAQQFVDVTVDYSATANNASDDDADDIQAAINAMTADGGVVYIPAGNFHIKSPIQLKDKVILKGAGRFHTYISGVFASKANLVDGSNLEDVRLSDLTLDGADDPEVENGLYLDTCENITIERLGVLDTNDEGILLGNGTFTNVKLSDVQVIGALKSGVKILDTSEDNSRILLTNVQIEGVPSNQPALDTYSPGIYKNITARLTSSYSTGIRVQPPVTGLGRGGGNSIFSGFRIESTTKNFTTGIEIGDKDILISDGVIDTVRWGVRILGKQLSSTYSDVQSVSVRGMVVKDTLAGIVVFAPQVTVSDSIVQDSGTGVYIQVHQDQVANTNVTDVTVQNATGVAFEVIDTHDFGLRGSDQINCINCRSIDSDTGFRITGDNAVIKGCMAIEGRRGARIISSGSIRPQNVRLLSCYFANNSEGNIDTNGAVNLVTDNNLSF